MRRTTSRPSVTSPKIENSPAPPPGSSCGVGASVTKNWLPLEPGPLFAYASSPAASKVCSGEVSMSKE